MAPDTLLRGGEPIPAKAAAFDNDWGGMEAPDMLRTDSDDEGDDEADGSSEVDLWDVEGDMTSEQVTAALAEEKRRKKAKIKAAKERAAFNMRLSSLRGESKLVEKEAIAARRAARNPLRKIETARATVKKAAAREWQLMKHDVEEAVTPAWLTHDKQRAEYLRRVARAERRMDKIYAELASVRLKREEKEKVEFISWKKRKREIKDLQVKERFLGTLVETTANERREQQVADFRRRVQMEIDESAEKEAARADAHRKKRSDDRMARRSAILSFWDKEQHVLQKEALAREQLRSKTVLNRSHGLAVEMDAEEVLRNAAREEDQMTGPWGVDRATNVSTGDKREGTAENVEGACHMNGSRIRQATKGPPDGLGIFSVATDDNEEIGGPLSSGRKGGGREAEDKARTDGQIVSLNQPVQQTAHEERWIKLGELEAEVGRCEALYAAVTEENRVAEEESKLLTSLRARLEREMVQIDEEHSAMLLVQRMANRDQTSTETGATHMRKTRKGVIRSSLRDAHERYIKSVATRKATEAQGLKLARQLAIIRERARSDREALESENGGRGSLPIIVGRSLPRAIATAKAVGHRHNRDDASGQRSNTGGSTSTGKKDGRRGNERTNDHEEIEMEDLIAGHPRRAVEELTMRARLEVVRGEVDEALKMHRTMARGERTSWLMQIERQNEQGAYQALLSRLARVTERLTLVDGENVRESLTSAIQLFSAAGAESLLESPVMKHVGLVPWWRHRDRLKSVGVERWQPHDVDEEVPRPRNVNEFGEKKCGDVGKELSEQESDMDEGMEGCKQGEREETKGRTGNRDETMGVSLGAMAQGHLVGVMPMPVDGLWTVRLAVTRRTVVDTDGNPIVIAGDKDEATDSVTDRQTNIGRDPPAKHGRKDGTSRADIFEHDPTDWVSVRIGPSLTALTDVASVKNVINDDLGEVRYELCHHFRGPALAFRFDFSSSSFVPAAHMSVEPGVFSTFEMAPVEWVGSRAVSSYVKELRLSVRSSKAFAIRLLEDMIQAEIVEEETWDSSVFHNTLQRYPRKDYCRLARETLDALREKEDEAKRDESRLHDIYRKMTMGSGDTTLTPDDNPDLAKTAAVAAQKLVRQLPAEERQIIRSMQSNDAYLRRKQASQSHLIVEAEAMIGKKIEIFDGAAATWRKVLVESVAVRWVDLGTRLVLRHVVRVLGAEVRGKSPIIMAVNEHTKVADGEHESGESGRRSDAARDCDIGLHADHTIETNGSSGKDADGGVGDATVEIDLCETRWGECTGGERRQSEAKAERFVATGGDVIRWDTEKIVARLAQEREHETERLRKSRRVEDRATKIALAEEVSKVKSGAQAENDILAARDKKTKEQIQRLARSLHQDWKLGIREPPPGKKATAGVALSVAKANWVADRVAKAAHLAEKEFIAVVQEAVVRRKKEDDTYQQGFRRKVADAEAARDAEVLRLERSAKLERERLIREELNIPGFEKALQRNVGCAHAHTKAWGDKYGSGLRCRACGMEATTTHKDVRQARGIGFGEDLVLVEAVERHRANEGGFRSETSAQLKDVENERIRLEKERRVCFAEYDRMFYDLDDPEMMYELDRRHRHWLKANGVIRQGVLWRKEELLAWFDKREEDGDNEAKEMKAVMIAWYDNATRAGPLTYRTYDGRRKARFLDILSLFNRINNSNLRISELKILARELTQERIAFREILRRAHSDISSLESITSQAETELGECERMMGMKKDADGRHRHWLDVLTEVKKDMTFAEMKLAGQDFLVAKSNGRLRDGTDQLREVLFHRLRSEAGLGAMKKRLSIVQARRQQHLEDHERLTHEIELFYYTKRDSRVVTPVGWATVSSYREADQTLIVTLPFCRPSARMWIPVEKVWQLDRAAQQAECVGMGAEDDLSKLLFRMEKATKVRECGHMLTEEGATRELMRREQEVEDERRLAVKIVAEAKATAPRLANMASISEHRNRWVAYKVQKAIEGRVKEIARWETRVAADDDDSVDSVKKPRKVKGAPERALMARRFRREFTALFIKAHVRNAEIRVDKMIKLRASRRAEESILNDIIKTYLTEFVKDIARETLRAGLLAKNRAEDETGLVFPEPCHMQYGVYSVFRSWWVGRKEQLRRSVERMNIVIAKNREKWEREHARMEAVQQSHLARGSKEEARIWTAKICAEMAQEEKATRAFNSWEWKVMLRERRAMMEAERQTRNYVRASKLEQLEQERRGKMKTTAQLKEEREQRLATMTEEEKQEFYQEEKEQKKQEWDKKQAEMLGQQPGASLDGMPGSVASNRERRRLSIKAAKVERRREAEEIAIMQLEDERSRLENEAYLVVIRLRVEREAHVARKAAAMRRQMAAEVSAAGAGQEAAAIVHSIVSEDGSFSAGGGANSGGGDGGSLAGGMSAEGITSGLPGGGEGSGDGFDEGGSEAGNVDASRGGPSMFDEDYVSSSESELADEDRTFAEEMGLPTGDGDLEDSEISDAEEQEDKNAKRKADAQAAKAAVATFSGLSGGGWARRGTGDGITFEGSLNNKAGAINETHDPSVAVAATSSTCHVEDEGDETQNGRHSCGSEADGQNAEDIRLDGTKPGDGQDTRSDDGDVIFRRDGNRSDKGGAGRVPRRDDDAQGMTSNTPDEQKLHDTFESANTAVTCKEAPDEKRHAGGSASANAVAIPISGSIATGLHRASPSSSTSVSPPSSSSKYSSHAWDDLSSGQGSDPSDLKGKEGPSRPATATTDRARRKRERAEAEDADFNRKRKDLRNEGSVSNRRQRSAKARPPPAPTSGGGIRGLSGGGGVSRRRMFAGRGSDESSSTSDESSSSEEEGLPNRPVSAKRKRDVIGGTDGRSQPGRAHRSEKRGEKAAKPSAVDVADADTFSEEESPEIARLEKQQKMIERRIQHKLGRQRQRVIKRLRRAKEIREMEDKKNAMRLEQANQVAQLEDARAELAWMDTEEEARTLQKRIAREEEGLRKLRLFCQVKAREEIACREEANARTAEARKRHSIRDETVLWHAKCKEQEHRTFKWKRRVEKETKFFNGRALTGQYQRWETEWIHPQLHSLYFKSLVDILVNRAELIGAERRSMKIHDRLVRTSQEMMKKGKLVVKLYMKQRRRELIYLRRSELGKRMFGKSQSTTLRKVFDAWKGFHMWLRNMREAFQLKYGVLKQNLDLDRVYQEVDAGSQRLENTRAPFGEAGALPQTKKSLLQRYKERPIRCRNCQAFYLEPQNHDLCCSYHPGEYRRACPRSCPGLTEKCMSHRAMRWTCCDKNDPGTWGSSGCKTRCHLPPFDGHPEFVDIVRKGAVEDRATLASLDRELETLSSKDVRSATLQLKQKQLGDMAEKLKKERDVVARYKDIKFV